MRVPTVDTHALEVVMRTSDQNIGNVSSLGSQFRQQSRRGAFTHSVATWHKACSFKQVKY